MRQTLPFPKSFPNNEELLFLQLLLCKDEVFLELFKQWSTHIEFEKIDHATSRLLPLLYKRLRKFSYTHDLSARIQGVYKLAWIKNQRLLDALGKIVPLLEERGISVLALKGIPLLLQAYQDVGARFLGDADLLIHPRYAKQAVEIMRQAGWKLESDRFPIYAQLSNDTLQRAIKEATFINDQHIEVDIHWRLFDFSDERKETLSFEELWERSLPFSSKDKTYHMPSPEDMLMHVIIHGSEGNSHRTLRWVTDAVAIIKTFEINWDQLLVEIKKGDRAVEMVVALSFLELYEFVMLPESFTQALFQIPLSEKEKTRYYRRANALKIRWGSFPRLWRTYWKYESRGAFPLSLVHFFDYLALVWGFEKKWEVFPFVLKKLKQRAEHYFKGR